MDLKNKKGLIVFVRHGETDWNTKGLMQGREDIPLNEVGIEQAEKTARGIKKSCENAGITFDKVVSSPLLRASVTGKMIADSVNCPVFYCDPRVTERDFGVLSGKPYDKNSVSITGDVHEIPSLERVSDLVERVNAFIKDTASENENVLVVTHGAVTRIYADNAKKKEGYTITAPFLLNCHLVVYEYRDNEAVLAGYNISSEELDRFLEEK